MTAKRKQRGAKFKIVKAWADVGTHGRIFLFAAGPIFDQYGPLMHIWPINDESKNLTPVEIRIPLTKREAGR